MTATDTTETDTTDRDPGPRARTVRPAWGWGRWIWRNLTSMRTAVILLGLLALASIPGSVLPQRGVASDPAAVGEFAREYPQLAPWLDRLGLFEVYASPWFAAIYLLLLVSMTGCVLPRCLHLWRAARSAPPAAPRHLRRLEHHREVTVTAEARAVLERAAAVLRRRRYRVVTDGDHVRAERGYLREIGNLTFHLSLLVLLVGVALGRLMGFEGIVIVSEGATFANTATEYDDFSPAVWTDVGNLEPFSFRLDTLEADFSTEAADLGQPQDFAATVRYRARPGATERTFRIQPNQPLNINETKVFLTGNGYAPRVTVRDGNGNVAFSGPAAFPPTDANYTSEGTIKVPGGQPDDLAFEGFFLPTAETGPQGPYSAFPGTLNPMLYLTAYTGDLGLDDGIPESVYTFDKSGMTQLRQDGKPFARGLAVGETMRLPDGTGSLTFDGVARFGNFQIAHDPGKEISLAAAVLLLGGVTVSLLVRRRQFWVRVHAGPEPGTTAVECATRSLSRRTTPDDDTRAVIEAIDRLAHHRAEDLREQPAGQAKGNTS